MPCQNGGGYVNILRGYLCVCNDDYFGTNCDSEYYFMMYIKPMFAYSTNYNKLVNMLKELNKKTTHDIVGLYITNTLF